MQWITKLIWVCLVVAPVDFSVAAEGNALGGFIRIANAVSCCEDVLTVKVDGEPIHETGYRAGDVTGGVWLSDGKHRLSFEMEGVRSAHATLQMRDGNHLVLIPHAVWQPATGGNEGAWEIRVLQMQPHQPDHGKTVSVVAVTGRTPLQVHVGQMDRSWKVYQPTLGQIERHPLGWPRGYAPVVVNGHRILTIPVASSANYVVVIHQGASGELRGFQFKDRIYTNRN